MLSAPVPERRVIATCIFSYATEMSFGLGVYPRLWCVFEMDGMVPSGSLWTWWLDTALNILYIRTACFHAHWEVFEGELQVDPSNGKSHRWQYRFKGCPKFLANYFLEDGMPIRPAHDNLERLLFPEGIHGTLSQYLSAVLGMVVDNPWNHHNVNKMMVRYVIGKQLERYASLNGDEDFCVWAATVRDPRDMVPLPDIAPWRRGHFRARMEDYPDLKAFTQFAISVCSLYARRSSGGIDAYQFMEIIRGDRHIGAG